METNQNQLYNPAEAEQIVRHLTGDSFNPEYILLFGSLAGGTPHSDPLTYDLLMVVRETPMYDWLKAQRYLRYKMPVRFREICYINLYILPWRYVESNMQNPFLYLAHKEGVLLYCKDDLLFRRPKRSCDFARAYAEAKNHFDTFHTLGCELIELAQQAFCETRNMRLAALFQAQAVVSFYHTLYYVYHGMEFGNHDPMVMHARMRTLSSKLMLSFDDNHIENTFTMPFLKEVLYKTRYDVNFNIEPRELESHLDRVEKMAETIQELCVKRLDLYKQRGERS